MVWTHIIKNIVNPFEVELGTHFCVYILQKASNIIYNFLLIYKIQNYSLCALPSERSLCINNLEATTVTLFKLPSEQKIIMNNIIRVKQKNNKEWAITHLRLCITPQCGLT